MSSGIKGTRRGDSNQGSGSDLSSVDPSSTCIQARPMTQIGSRLGARVREERLSRRLSQERLAELCGLDRTYISGIERGVRNPTLTVVHALSLGLGLTVEELLRGV